MEYKKNADGTDMLDESGNPIPADKPNEGGEEIAKEVEGLKETVTNLVEELKKERQEKGVYKNLLDKFNEKPETPITPDADEERIVNVIKKVLGTEKASRAETNKQVAFERFIAENKEFHPENDITGLKRRALEEKIARRFNTDGLSEVGDFEQVIREAHILLKNNDSSPESLKEVKNPYSTTPISKTTPVTRDDKNLSIKEKKLIEQGSITLEKLLKLKEARPEFLEDLLKYVRD